MGDGLNYSVLGPLFPTEAAIHKHVSTTFVGVITGTFDAANFIATISLSSVFSPVNQKFFFCTGALITSTCNALFGLMGYREVFPFNVVGFLESLFRI